MNIQFDDMAVLLEELGVGEQKLADARTAALEQTVAAYYQQSNQYWSNWLGSMTTSDLAPVQSKEALDNQYQTLLGAAQGGDYGALQALGSFVQGEYLPFMQGYGGYQDVWNSLFGPARPPQPPDVSVGPWEQGPVPGIGAPGPGIFEPPGGYGDLTSIGAGDYNVPIGMDPAAFAEALAPYLLAIEAKLPTATVINLDGEEIANSTVDQIGQGTGTEQLVATLTPFFGTDPYQGWGGD